MISKQQAKAEFDSLLNDDPDFQEQWENSFYEWCGNYDDLKHITKPQ